MELVVQFQKKITLKCNSSPHQYLAFIAIGVPVSHCSSRCVSIVILVSIAIESLCFSSEKLKGLSRCHSLQFTRHRWNYSASSGSAGGEQQGGCKPSADGLVSRQPVDGSTLIPWCSVLRWDLKEMLHRPCHAPAKLCCSFCRSSASQAFF